MCDPSGPNSLGPGARRPRPKCPVAKLPGPKSQGGERLGPKRPGVKRPGPKCTCAKRPGPKRPYLKRPGMKYAARFSLKSIKYHFNVVEGKSGVRVTKAVDVVVCPSTGNKSG